MHLREREEKGRMKPDWAELYDEHVATYYKRNGQCQNPHCGHRPIHLRHILRHKHSGETLEIGHICFLRWQAYHGLTEPELMEYEETREYVTSRGGRITGPEYARFEKETLKERRIKVLKKKGQLKRVDFPLSQFSTQENAEKYAEKHGGYCSGKITMRESQYWCLYIPKNEVPKNKGIVR